MSELTDIAFDYLLNTVVEKSDEEGNCEIVAIAFEQETESMSIWEIELERVEMVPLPSPKRKEIKNLWQVDAWPEVIEEIRSLCVQKNFLYCAIASEARVVLRDEPDNMQDALYCHVETLDEAQELVAVPLGGLEFMVAELGEADHCIFVDDDD